MIQIVKRIDKKAPWSDLRGRWYRGVFMMFFGVEDKSGNEDGGNMGEMGTNVVRLWPCAKRPLGPRPACKAARVRGWDVGQISGTISCAKGSSARASMERNLRQKREDDAEMRRREQVAFPNGSMFAAISCGAVG